MPRIPDVENFLPHFLRIVLPERHFAHAADRINRCSYFVADIGEKIVLALLRFHQRFDDLIHFLIPLRPVPQPDKKNKQHAQNIPKLGRQTADFLPRHPFKRPGDDAVIKNNKADRSQRNPEKFRNTKKRNDNRHRHKSRHNDG